MIEFIFDLTARGSKAILMFIPGDCRDDVDLAVEAFMSLETEINEIIAVWQTGINASGVAIFDAMTHYTVA